MVSCVGLAFGAEQSKVQSLEGLQAKFDGSVPEIQQQKLLEAATKNFRSFEQWELLIHSSQFLLEVFAGSGYSISDPSFCHATLCSRRESYLIPRALITRFTNGQLSAHARNFSQFPN